MSSIVNLNGVPYLIPDTGEVGWGQQVHNYLVALGSGGVLQLSGGDFPLLSELNFGPTYGLATPYYRSGAANSAATGVFRLTNTETLAWRNNSNTSDLSLSVVGNELYFAGSPVAVGIGSGSPLTTKGDLYTYSTTNTRLPVGTTGQFLIADSSTETGLAWTSSGGGGGGGVSGFSFVDANGFVGSVANATTTPALTLALGNIVPTSVAAISTVTGSNLSGTHTGNSSGTNTGDQTITLTGDVSGSGTGSFATTLATVGIAKGGTGQTTANAAFNALAPSQSGNSGKLLYTDGANTSWVAFTGAGTVSSVSGTGSQGVTVSVANPTTTPAFSIGLGAITPTSVAATGTVTGSNISGTASGTNTGDQTISLSGDVTGTGTAGITATLSNTAVTPGSYTRANITVDSKGRITAASAEPAQTITLTGDVSGSGTGSFVTTLANSGVAVGTYNNVTVNAKGIVTTGSNASYLTANQTITVSGDVSGSGTTALTLTLPNIVGAPGNFAGVSINAKGQATAGINLSGDVTTSGTIATLANTTVAAGSYTLPTITIDSKGRITSAANGGTSVANLIITSALVGAGVSAGTNLYGVANNNVAVGYQALNAVSQARYNTAVGDNASRYTTGASNTSLGYYAYQTGTTGFLNTALGREALYNVTTGSNNTGVGYNALAASSSATNSVTLGNSSITTLRCQVTSITALSDSRDKTDVAPLNYGLDFVDALRPVAFTWNTRDGAKVGIKSSGFIAQDLKATQEAFNAQDTLNLVYEENPEKLEATYGNLIPVLVRAIQELKAEIDSLKNQLNK